MHNVNITYCVRNVNAALVIDDGRFKPFVISLHNFLLMTSTKPPFETTNRNSSYKSRVCLAIIGILFTGVPEKYNKLNFMYFCIRKLTDTKPRYHMQGCNFGVHVGRGVEKNCKYGFFHFKFRPSLPLTLQP